jgi:hypothetical protein
MNVRAAWVLLALAACSSPANPPRDEGLSLHIIGKGAPLADAQLMIHPLGGECDHHECKTFVSDKSGRVCLDRLHAGTYRVDVYHPIYVPLTRKVEVTGAPGEKIDLTLTEGGRVVGTVLDARGAPVADATVRAIDPNGLIEFNQAKTDASGRFEMTGLPIQPLRFYVHSGYHRPGHADTREIKKPGDLAQVSISLRDGKSLAGKVVNVDGTPVQGATVGCTDEGSLFFETGADGLFRLGGLGDEPVNAYAYKVGLAPHHIKQVAPGSTELVFVLRPPATVRGAFQFPQGLPEAIVSLVRDELKVATCIVRPVNAKFEFQDLVAGKYILQVEGPDGPIHRSDVTLAEGQSVDVGAVAPHGSINLREDKR